MNFKGYFDKPILREFKEAMLKMGRGKRTAKEMQFFNWIHRPDVIVFYYTPETNLVWTDFYGNVYRGKKKIGSAPFGGHGSIVRVSGDHGLNFFDREKTVAGRIDRNKVVGIWDTGELPTRTRKYIKNKAMDAIYKYIGDEIFEQNPQEKT